MGPFFRWDMASAYIDPPQGWVGWLGFFLFLSYLGYEAWRWRSLNASFDGRLRWLLLGLMLLVPLTGLVGGLQLSAQNAIPTPGLPSEEAVPVAMLLSALPWMLAGGFLGPIPAMALAMLAGVFSASLGNHNSFTILEMGLLAGLFGMLMRQRYRTRFYRLARRPLVAALLLALLYPLLHLLLTPFMVQGLLADRMQYAISTVAASSMAVGIELLVGGLLAELAALVFKGWGGRGPLEPSPAERSLQTRFIAGLTPLALILMLTLVAGDWIIAGQAAQTLLQQQMGATAAMAADNVPYFLETGQSLIQQISAQPELSDDDPQTVEQALSDAIRVAPFFNQLAVIDINGDAIAAYPNSYAVGKQAPVEEQMGIQMAMTGTPFQIFTIPPAAGQTTAQVSFVAAIEEDGQPVSRVLVGRSDLSENTFTKPILTALNALAGQDGQGMLLDENQRILVHPDPSRVMSTYDGQMADTQLFFTGPAWDGTQQMFTYQPAPGRAWAVVLSVPVSRAQQLALQIAAPLLLMLVLIAMAAVVFVRLSLRAVTRSLEKLTGEAGRLAEGRLEKPVSVDSADEVGQLGRAFEQMRVSLKARLDELNRLLLVSQGVASTLEVSEAVQPVLESALSQGSAARLVLSPSLLPEWNSGPGSTNGPVSFGMGAANHQYRYLDEQILALTRGQERLVLSNLLRPRLLTLTPGLPRPESIIAVALRHEGEYYGALWVAYDQPHTFSEEEVRFLATLAGQAALAAMNARLFLTAEIGRRRLESILDSSPDPILVTDQHDCLLLANPAAYQTLSLAEHSARAVDEAGGEAASDAPIGAPIDRLLEQSELVDLLRSSNAEKSSAEIVLPGGRVYLATATPVLAEGQRVGRVCVLRDVTHFKELDALKSDFVSTVSHDLRSPLTLMRGYATMLEMVGQLNEQQTGYVRKIITGVESMSRLVNNLLNLGRIEAGVGLQLEMIPVQDVLERVVNGLQLSAAQKHIQLTMEIPQGTIPLIEGDQALIQQAVQNLVENAIKYTKPDGKVHVKVQVQPMGMVFQVQDTGVGVSPMDLPRLFEKFYRGAQQGSTDARGTGLGLAIVKSIAERHGGRAWAESQLGKGSTFYFSVPLRQPKAGG